MVSKLIFSMKYYQHGDSIQDTEVRGAKAKQAVLTTGVHAVAALPPRVQVPATVLTAQQFL